MSSVRLENVYKYYDKNPNPAVSDFTFEIKDKEFVVFVGPSGCGKSTTLRMIAGLEDISKGNIYIDDKLVNNVEPKDRDIAMVFQSYALYPHMSVYDNMAFGLRLKKIDDVKTNKKGEEIHFKRHYTKKEIDDKVHEAARTLEITEYLNRKPKQLSGGQRQRVAIGRAIVRKPKVFLMDEPLSNLDAKLRHQMRSEIILLRKRINTTFIYVTHDQVEAMTLGDRIVIMKDGFIQQVGTPSEVFNHPVNLFVAGFIGTPHMNFIDGKLDEVGKVMVGDVEVKLSKEKLEELNKKEAKCSDIVVGIRPEHILLDKNGQFKSKVLLYEMMGSEYHIHTELNGCKIVIRTQILGLSKEQENSIMTNGEISYSFSADAVHVFDKQTENNLV